MTRRPTVFTFWEPRDAVVPYIRLCMATWRLALDADDVVVLDYANLPEFLDDASFVEAIKPLPLPVQKDAVMVAVLRKHGGVFMDADTLAVGDIEPLVDRLDDAEVVMFNTHLAFVAARRDSRLLARWYAGLREKLARTDEAEVAWDYAGNSVLTSAMDEIVETHERKPLPVAVADRAAALVEKYGTGPSMARLRHAIRWRRRALYFRTVYRKHLTMLERDAYGFMPERVYPGREGSDPREQYERYWFQTDAPLETVLLPNQTIIGLHNTWTPDWYKRLSEAEVLAHPCLLSRTLSHLLGRASERRAVEARRDHDDAARLARILHENIVPFWYPRSLDRERGGYHTHYDAAGRPKPPGVRMIVSQARMLWFFSRLARFGHRPDDMLDAARHGERFLRETMWDVRHAGFFWEVDAAGTPTEPGKHVCGQVYALYALAEYARASGRSDVLALADEVFDLLEEKAHDSTYGGYVEWFAPDWAPGPPGATPLGEGTARAKLMGTHLHAMEAIAAYCRVSPRPVARQRLAELIAIQTSAVVRKGSMASRSRHARDWTPQPDPDGDRISYGHDLENIWLIADACAALDVAVHPHIDFFRASFAYAMRHGWDERHGGFFNAGPPNAAADRRSKWWWVQCEALVAALLMYRLTGDAQYRDVFRRTLAFVERYLVDWESGEWHLEVDEALRGSGDKASVWKAAYHSGRAMMECIELLRITEVEVCRPCK